MTFKHGLHHLIVSEYKLEMPPTRFHTVMEFDHISTHKTHYVAAGGYAMIRVDSRYKTATSIGRQENVLQAVHLAWIGHYEFQLKNIYCVLFAFKREFH